MESPVGVVQYMPYHKLHDRYSPPMIKDVSCQAPSNVNHFPRQKKNWIEYHELK